MFFLKQKKITEHEQEILKLKEEIKECEFLIKRNNNMFDMTIDDELIEARIYEMQSLNKHHQYLLKLLKEKQVVTTDTKNSGYNITV